MGFDRLTECRRTVTGNSGRIAGSNPFVLQRPIWPRTRKKGLDLEVTPHRDSAGTRRRWKLR